MEYWDNVLAFGFLGASYLLISIGVLAIGFILKTLVGIFSKPARDASTMQFLEGAASFVGLIIASFFSFCYFVFFILMMAMIFLGIPIAIISKLFGLW